MEKDRKIQGGFKIPEDYMKGLEDRILNAGNAKENGLQSPGEEFKEHFKLPPSYFDDLEDRIVSKSKSRVISLPRRGISIFALAAAASVALLISINVWPDRNSEVNSLTDLQANDILSFIEEDYGLFHSSDIADAFEDVDLESEIYAEMDIENYLEEVDLENIITEN